MKYLRLWVVLLLLPVMQLHGQQYAEQYFDHYTTASGLSHNTVTGIAQDSTGYVWISTSSGLNRFNGYSFLQFHSNSDSLSIPSEETMGMSLRNKRWLAVFTSGLHLVDTRTGRTKNIYIPYHNLFYQFKYNMIERVLGDEQDNLYVLSRSGFYHFDSSGALLSRFDYYTEAEVPVTHFFFGRELFELDSHRLLIVSVAGFYIYDKTTRQTKKMEPKDCPVWAGFFQYPQSYYTFFQHKPGHFFVLKTDSDSLIYVNTITHKKIVSRLPFPAGKQDFHFRSRMTAANDTVFYVTGQNAGFYKMYFNPSSGKLRLDSTKYFRSYLCSGLMMDQEQHLWVTTNRGVFRQNNQRSSVQVTQLPESIDQRFPHFRLDDIHVSANKVYAAGRGDAGLFIFDKKTFRLDKQILFSRQSNTIRAIAAADASKLLLATNGLLLLFDKTTGKATPLTPPGWYDSWASDLMRDRKGNIWITSNQIYSYQPASRKFTIIPNFQRLLSIPFVLDEDTTGNIWIAGHGLARYNTALSRFDIGLDSFPYIKMPDKQVNALAVDSRNNVWFNSNNNGLASYDITTGRFRHFTRSQGLPDDNIASLYILGNQLWIACYSGIACMDLTSSRIVSFGKEDGFPEMPILKGARFSYDSTNKQLYIGFSTAVVRFDPNEVLQRKLPPRAFIESLVINGKTNIFLPQEELTTSWEDNDVKITIGTISFSAGSSQFAYRILKDSNTQWTLTGDQSSFNISALPPGKHLIQVKAYSPSNRWPEQLKAISITVLPPLWGKQWFILLMGLTGAALFYLFIKWRTGLARRKEMEKTHIEKLKAENYKNRFELEQVSNYFSSSLAGKKTEEEVLWDVAQNLIGRMNYEDCMIYLWNSDKTKMVQKAAYGQKGKPEFISGQQFDVLPGQGVVGHVMNTRQPYLVVDTRKELRYRVDEAFRLSEVCVPIIHNDELIGVIDSEHHIPGYFKDRDIQILTTIATLIGNKLKQLESEQTLDATHRELDTINEQLAEARLSALQAQMNPHFVFNALNSIKRMILDGDNEKASRYLSKFALMIRMTLNHSKELFVTLDDNIAYLRSYLEMEQLRFDDSFTYHIETDDTIDTMETSIPSMMIQPLVENAIWHGLMPSGTDKKIWIRFTEQDNRITCVVEDNGIGIRQSEKLKQQNRAHHHSVGLENLRKRIKIMNEKYALACSLEVTDLQETGEGRNGTRVILALNMINV